jgi:hypothetical protein
MSNRWAVLGVLSSVRGCNVSQVGCAGCAKFGSRL